MHFLKTSLISFLTLAVAVSSASLPTNDAERVQFWENRISTFQKENKLDDDQTNALTSALEIVRNQDADSYDSMKESVIDALGFDQAKALFVPTGDSQNKRETGQSPNRHMLRARQLPGCETCPDCVCSYYDGSDCKKGTVCRADLNQDKMCRHYTGGCGWGGLQGCQGLCFPA